MDKSHLGHVSIFWGDGKGKTTAALGTALRAVGNGYTVHLVQCMKNGAGDPEIEHPGELKALSQFPGFSYNRFGSGEWIIGKPNNDALASFQEALTHIRASFGTYDIIIADEFLYAIQLGLCTEADILTLIIEKPSNQELILTGSHVAYPRLFEHADLVTEIKKIKHPYDQGKLARKGIEY
ncbi:cob(I)yrinic acid a,c-diamide adenosyltransferase [Candidatus Pacearchaeota archaeon]|nr:cob(I)yrinic acid a,c-diamide adenosyltransferase [Candidatus Pacearchaeota archaeon]